jgi:hypothetical protein
MPNSYQLPKSVTINSSVPTFRDAKKASGLVTVGSGVVALDGFTTINERDQSEGDSPLY